jgi:hypothetical protein
MGLSVMYNNGPFSTMWNTSTTVGEMLSAWVYVLQILVVPPLAPPVITILGYNHSSLGFIPYNQSAFMSPLVPCYHLAKDAQTIVLITVATGAHTAFPIVIFTNTHGLYLQVWPVGSA